MDKLERQLERHKQLIRSGFVVLLVLVFFLYGVQRIRMVGYPSPTSTILIGSLLGAGALGIAFILLLHWLSFCKDIRIERLFLFSAIVLSLAYMAFFAPISVPDEQAHYLSAYRLSNYFLFRFGQMGNPDLLIRSADLQFFSTFSTSGTLNPERYIQTIKGFSFFVGNSEVVTYSANAVTNVPLGYLASALGIALGRLLHLGSIPVFYLGRMCNMALYIGLAYGAMRRIPFGKIVIFIVSLFPMTLHLCASYSYDCMIIGVSMLFVAEVLRMIYGDAVRRGQLIFCAVLCFVLAPSKLVYTPLLFLVLLIPTEKIKAVFPHPNVLKVLLIAAGILGLLVGQLGSMASYVSADSGAAYVDWAGQEGYSLSWVLQNPVSTVVIFINTVLDMGDFYLSSLLGGSLGWLQITVPDLLCLPFAAMFCLACLKKRQEEAEPLSFLSKCWTLILVLGSCGLILASMFLSWTPISSGVILGAQGRYFLPLLPALFLLLRSNAVTVDERMDRHIAFVAGTLNILVLAYSFLFVFGAI